MGTLVDNVIAFRACEALPAMSRVEPVPVGADPSTINLLRSFAVESQIRPRYEKTHTCSIVHPDPGDGLRRTALVFFATLSEVANQRLGFYRPNTAEFSDAEIWLGRVIVAFSEESLAQARALIAWRVKPVGHRRIAFLAERLAYALNEFQKEPRHEAFRIQSELK